MQGQARTLAGRSVPTSNVRNVKVRFMLADSTFETASFG